MLSHALGRSNLLSLTGSNMIFLYGFILRFLVSLALPMYTVLQLQKQHILRDDRIDSSDRGPIEPRSKSKWHQESGRGRRVSPRLRLHSQCAGRTTQKLTATSPCAHIAEGSSKVPTKPFIYYDELGKLQTLRSVSNVFGRPFNPQSREWTHVRRPNDWPEEMPWPADVIRCRRWDGKCLVCGTRPDGRVACGCSIEAWRRAHEWPTVRELRMLPNKGIGAITRRTWQRGDVLGDYVGEVRPYNDHEQNAYCLAVSILGASSRRIAMIDSSRAGNWTRFVNHSCRSNLKFKEMNVGGYRIYALVTIRAIEVGEELTVDYGPSYMTGGGERCHCGEPRCRYLKLRQSGARDEH